VKSYRKELWFNTSRRVEFINVTPQVYQCLKESGIREGMVLVNARHITASVFINDDESGLHQDFEAWLEKLAPENLTVSTGTTPARTMPTPTSSGASWAARWSWP
jgi:secondary thiamine-phosphate synthase enzyme